MSKPRTLTVRTTKEVERKFRIRYESDLVNDAGESSDGFIVLADGEIVVDKELLPSDMASTLFHEAVHAACPDLSEEAVLRIEGAVFRVHKALCRMQ